MTETIDELGFTLYIDTTKQTIKESCETIDELREAFKNHMETIE